MKETPATREAFEDYYGLGAERSIEKLVRLYAERKQNGDEVPSTTRSTTITAGFVLHSGTPLPAWRNGPKATDSHREL